jgi:hypothetical protein
MIMKIEKIHTDRSLRCTNISLKNTLNELEILKLEW